MVAIIVNFVACCAVASVVVIIIVVVITHPRHSRRRRILTILRTFIAGSKHPLANNLFDMFGVNHGIERLWPIPLHVA